MPFRCSVYNCTGNYDTGQKVTVFKFPKEESFAKLWVHRIKRKDFKLSSSSRVCERHFREEDILRETEIMDKKSMKMLKVPLKYPKLKKDAVPTIIPGCSSNLQPSAVQPRESPESKRKKLELRDLEQAIAASESSKKDYDELNEYRSVSELKVRLSREDISEIYTIIEKDDNVMFLVISEDISELLCSVIISPDLQVTVKLKNQLIKKLEILFY